MKTKLVLWGTNAQEERVLIALELLEEENKVNLYTFPSAIVNDAFDKAMHEKWREGEAVEMPEGYTKEERSLSVSDGLLPETLKVERTDLISRAQTEWHFMVLSSKLNKMFESELEHLKGKVNELTTFDQSTWDMLKEFWDKINTQTRERNLLQKQAGLLRDNTNKLFEELKELKTKVNEEFAVQSKTIFEEYGTLLDDIETRMTSGNARFNTIFEDLKRVQGKFKDAALTGAHRSKLWDRIDTLFKKSREDRFGKGAANAPADQLGHLTNRLNGLNDAINRMQTSINYDQKDLDFEKNRMASTSSQLEMQLREAKLKMIEERLSSKTIKLTDMLATREKVEAQLKTAESRAEKSGAKPAGAESLGAQDKAKKDAPKKESILDAINNVLSEPLENMITSVQAVAAVVGEKIEEAVAEATAKAEAFADEILAEQQKAEDAEAVVVEVKQPTAAASTKIAVTEVTADAPTATAEVSEDIADAAAAEAVTDEEKKDKSEEEA